MTMILFVELPLDRAVPASQSTVRCLSVCLSVSEYEESLNRCVRRLMSRLLLLLDVR